MTGAEVVPLELAAARRYIAEHHRHSEPPLGHRFSIGLRRGGELVGVVIAGRPVARGLDDGRTLELTRLATEGERNACSRLYSAACRAAFAMGYLRVVTYTLAEERGSSLRAAGFREDALLEARDGVLAWGAYREGSAQHRLPLWGEPAAIPTGPKRRWVRVA